MTTINERLQLIVDDRFGGNKAQFAKAIDIAPTSISNYLSEKRQSKPSSDMLERIINVVHDLSPLWLLTGRGEMFPTPTEPQPKQEPITVERLLSIVESQQRTIENLSRK